VVEAADWFDGERPNKYEALAQACFRAVQVMLGCVLGLFTAVLKSAGSLGEWYGSLPLELQAALEIALILLLVSSLLSCMRSPRRVVTTSGKREPDRFIGARTTDRGVVYDVVAGGVHYSLPVVVTGEVDIVEEMSVPGSEFFPSARRPVGAIMVATDSVDLHVLGVFWRMGDALITARHVANGLSSSVADVYLAPVKATNKGKFVVGSVTLVSRSLFDAEANWFRTFRWTFSLVS